MYWRAGEQLAEFKYGPVRFKREINAVSIRIKRSIQASVSIIPFLDVYKRQGFQREKAVRT